MRTGAIMVLLLLAGGTASALDMRTAWSPHNRKRPERPSTLYIVLHTTEAPFDGSLSNVRDNGEANYLAAPDGVVYRIIDRDRVAYHAGRSMWEGRINLDTCSVGIEVVGYHNRIPSAKQIAALRELVNYLKAKFGVPDHRVLTHSMVAYGAPNRWHRLPHRGRKRCGMMLAAKAIRRQLGLATDPPFDPDVKAGRLVVGDPLLARVLYGPMQEQESDASAARVAEDANIVTPTRSPWDIARDAYNDATTLYELPDGRRMNGAEVRDWIAILPGTRVIVGQPAGESGSERLRELGKDGATPQELAGESYNTATTVYFLPDGRTLCGNEVTEWPLPDKTKVLVGYRYAGMVTPNRSAYAICGDTWRLAMTYYRFPDGAVRPGTDISQKTIPPRTRVFVRD
jgi:hypothetical protein